MSEEEVIIALVAVIGGIGFLSFVMHNIFSLIRTAIERKNPLPLAVLILNFFEHWQISKNQLNRD